MEVDESVSVDIDDSLATLSLGHAEEQTITLSLRRMESLQDALDRLRQAATAGEVCGVVVRGATPNSFCVGADLKLLRALQVQDADRLRQLLASARRLSDDQRQRLESFIDEQSFAALAEELALLGKEILQNLATLGVPTVAAISGACVGGGLELALHCQRIVAAASTSIFSGGIKTEIGFPEPMLGLLEGWGGIELTVRRIGLRRALPLLLQGRTITPEQALRRGMIDAVVAGDELYDYAEKVARQKTTLPRRRLSIVDRMLTSTAAGRRIVSDGLRLPLLGKVVPGVRDALAEFPPKHYPAPHAILEVALHELQNPPPAGSLLASKRFGELALSAQSEALVHVLFFGTEAAKARAKQGPKLEGLHCLVVGAGQMGAGIAHALLRSGHRVLLHDTHAAALEGARSRIDEWIVKDRKLSPDDKAQAQRNIRYEEQLPQNLGEVEFVVEAIVENAELKQQLLARISSRLDPSAAIATNTSSIPIAVLAEAVERPQRFFGMHFFNPVRKMRLVEIIRGPQTGEQAVALGAALAAALGKYPVVVQDVPGFLVNRMLFPYLNEAVKLLLDGHEIAAIDEAAERFGMLMGPLKMLDLVGFDVAREVARILTAAYPHRMQPPTLRSNFDSDVSWETVLDALAQRQVLGKKSGRGFFIYDGRKGSRRPPRPNPIFSDAAFWAEFGANAPVPRPPQLDAAGDRLIYSLLDEAELCLQEGVAGDVRSEAALQIDLASVLGFGFAPFRGGVIHFGERAVRPEPASSAGAR